jgi:hypothetical protein
MAEAGRHSRNVGWVGVLCLTIYWAGKLAPEIDEAFTLSSFGKLVVFGALLAGVLLTTIAAIRGSRLWLVAVAVSAITLADACVGFLGALR